MLMVAGYAGGQSFRDVSCKLYARTSPLEIELLETRCFSCWQKKAHEDSKKNLSAIHRDETEYFTLILLDVF